MTCPHSSTAAWMFTFICHFPLSQGLILGTLHAPSAKPYGPYQVARWPLFQAQHLLPGPDDTPVSHTASVCPTSAPLLNLYIILSTLMPAGPCQDTLHPSRGEGVGGAEERRINRLKEKKKTLTT